jgi:hypothetical protein
MKPEIKLIEVKPGVYVIGVQANGPAVAVYWKHSDGTSSLMKAGKRRVDMEKKLGDNKELSIHDAKARRAQFELIRGGRYEEGPNQASSANGSDHRG